MFVIQFLTILSAFVIVITKEDWVEIPQKISSSTSTKIFGTTYVSETKTPMNVILNTELVENLESHNNTTEHFIQKDNFFTNNASNIKNNNRITMKPAKSSVKEIFSKSSSTSTEFTPLMSSVSIAMTSPVTTPIPPKHTPELRNLRSKRKNYSIKNETGNNLNHNEDKVDDFENSYSTYSGFMPFIRSIQSTLLQRAHKTVKSKIQILKNLRDNLLYEIDQRIQKLWSTDENSAREYKGESHIEFPSNEGALMTIGFLTLAVFLVKLVLQVIAAIKAKKAYYTTTTTTAATTGRKKRSILDNNLDVETTYRILNLIDTFKVNSFDYN